MQFNTLTLNRGRMRRMSAIAVAAAAVAGSFLAAEPGTPALAGSTAWKVYAPTNPDYPQKVDFVVPCSVVKMANDDAIVFPGQPGASHNHTFSGNLGITASSTPESLLKTQSNCKLSADRASYWTPTLYANGAAVTPTTTRAYYRAGTRNGASIKPMPFGLRMIAGDAKAMAPQDARIAGFHCRDTSGALTSKTSLPPRCPSNAFLEASVVFPNCWDGKNLDSANHKSHMAYADWKTFACPAGYPVHLPQLTVAQRYPVNATFNKAVTLAAMSMPGMTMDSRLTLHADFMNAWDPAMMKALVRRCINASVACEDVTDRRLPPGM